jgi:LysR family glycine cleavage system transcriptional activator
MKFMALHPDIEFALSHMSAEPHHDLQTLLKENGTGSDDLYDGCTMTIVADSTIPHGLNSDCLFAADVVPLCNPRARTKAHSRDSVRTLSSEILLCEMPHNTWPNWLSKAGASDISPLGRLYFNDPAALVQVGATGQGVFMGSPSLLRSYISDGTLAAPLGEEIRIQRSYYLVYDEAVQQHACAAAFRSWLLREISIFKDQGPPKKPSRASSMRRAAA